VEGEAVKKRKPTHRKPTIGERLVPFAPLLCLIILMGIAGSYFIHPMPQEETWMDAPYIVIKRSNPTATPLLVPVQAWVINDGTFFRMDHIEFSGSAGVLFCPKTKPHKRPKPAPAPSGCSFDVPRE
jgi:hypothetical protein